MSQATRPSRILCVTGTGTDIGKSSLSLAVLLWARSRGLRAGYLKPVQCGSRDKAHGGMPHFGDPDWIRTACPEVEEAGAVYTFPDAVSPHLAAERAGAWIDAEWILEQAVAAARRVDLLVVEGAGGAAVPLNREGFSLADIACSGTWPCLIAALPGLGTLHHTITTAHYLAERGATVAGFAFVQSSPENSPVANDNVATLESILKLPHFGTVPYVPGLGRNLPPSPAASSLLASSLPGLDAWWGA
ncbi:MAG TPA: dethiobiotin synthase [Fibrobacteria bacterium]|jgi:dethiobiotin synthetase|nr:dethiobiotin synthase [Fibrobacteria bacterium]